MQQCVVMNRKNCMPQHLSRIPDEYHRQDTNLVCDALT